MARGRGRPRKQIAHKRLPSSSSSNCNLVCGVPSHSGSKLIRAAGHHSRKRGAQPTNILTPPTRGQAVHLMFQGGPWVVLWNTIHHQGTDYKRSLSNS
ncbi:unnamed protein product [Amaranthus hypochondriacus]